MLRFILKHEWSDRHSGAAGANFRTVDVDVPELESVLKEGGSGMDEYSMNTLLGVEVLATTPKGAQ